MTRPLAPNCVQCLDQHIECSVVEDSFRIIGGRLFRQEGRRRLRVCVRVPFQKGLVCFGALLNEFSPTTGAQPHLPRYAASLAFRAASGESPVEVSQRAAQVPVDWRRVLATASAMRPYMQRDP